MRFSQLPRLEHPLVELRPLVEADIPGWAAYLNNPLVYEHTSWNSPTVSDLNAYCGTHLSGDPDSHLRLAVALRASGQLVGTAGFHSVSSLNKSLELAYDLEPAHWGSGLATAAAAALVQWAHDTAGFNRVQATVLSSNERSIRTLERLGFVREGLLHSYRIVRGTPGDFYMYAHLGRSASAA